MNKKIQKSEDRGRAQSNWLEARYYFSFANYYNPDRTGFGKLLVLNDDIIAPGKGFGTHPHQNMEIITIPTFGKLAHKDSTGSEEVIVPGQIQVMSAGSGVFHSEYNGSETQETKLFQIWIEPSKRNINPRHETKTLNLEKNSLKKIVSGIKDKETLFINQDASIYLGEFDKNNKIIFNTKKEKGVFILVIEGNIKIGDDKLSTRDSIEITNTDKIIIEISGNTKILLIEVPMK